MHFINLFASEVKHSKNFSDFFSFDDGLSFEVASIWDFKGVIVVPSKNVQRFYTGKENVIYLELLSCFLVIRFGGAFSED